MPSSFNISLTICVILFTIVGIGNIIRSLKSEKHIRNKIKINKNLAQKGILVKNLPYFTNEAGIYKYVYIKYTINGNEKTFKSQIPYSEAQLTSDGTFDLLYDPNNPKNYYVDTEIY